MKVKLILGEYAYLYHGNLELQAIFNFIKNITQYQFILKWKDQDEEMIRIIRPQDLKYCVDIASKQKQTLRLYIQECLPNFQFNIQKQDQQSQIQQSMLQSNIQQGQFSNQIEQGYPQIKKEMTFNGRFSNENDSKQIIFDSKQTQKQFQQIALKFMQEVYPGLQFDQDDNNEKDQIEYMQNTSLQFGQIDQINPRKIQSRQNTEKMTPQWKEKQQDENYIPDNLQNENKQGLNLKIDDNSNSDTILSQRQNDNFEDTYFCDYCSEQIEIKNIYKCLNLDCSELHFCKQCLENFGKDKLHDHDLVELIKII
ncbi:unnamed protein product [Paramecium primaurelia]|uniref:PB1 domain-containing protein n=1 Tax=Paramecium primaurelia TaxID=5886 RepID=A0A8S1N0Q3_PARPR|nr:unnamed protein product [Paramecium primaurelia]